MHTLRPGVNHLQEQLDSLETFSSSKLLKIKERKTSIMKFNFSRKTDFPPEFSIRGFNDQVEVISETRLLGIILTNDLKWGANTAFICKKAYSKMWTLRRMKVLDLDPSIILDVYCAILAQWFNFETVFRYRKSSESGCSYHP